MKKSKLTKTKTRSVMKSAIATLLALILMLAGCVSPQNGGESTPTETPLASSPSSGEASSPSTPAESSPESESSPEAESSSTPAPESTPEEDVIVDPEDLKTVETFIDPQVMEGITALFESKSNLFACYVTDPSPFAMRNSETVRNGKLLSITIPVYKTLAADENGDFSFTISVINAENVRLAPSRKYTVKVNGEKCGIEANDASVFKMIKVDLTEYDIVLGENETVAFFGASDTLFPGYLLKDEGNTNEAAKYWKLNAPQSLGFYTYAGRGFSLGESKNSLIFDFEIERTHQTLADKNAAENAEADLATMIEALKEKYGGKKLSILGDSISTFRGISNNVNYNKSISNNAVYYPDKDTDFTSKTSLYWGRLIEDLGMELCVDNAWSGSRVYGQSGCSYNDSMPRRATELSHRRNGDPDLILVFMGINDLHNSPAQVPFGGLYNKLKNVEGDEARRAVVEEWFANVLATANANPGYEAGKSYTEWAEAYALGLYEMKNKYGSADIYCMTLVKNLDSRCTNEKLLAFNTCIRALADYFGIGLIDQEMDGYITPDNCYSYTGDSTALHPSPYGHVLMEKLIIETLYKDLNK